MSNNNFQQAQAVTNTLAGEKLVQTVNFPLTGDSEMDFIGGLIAVWQSIGLHPESAARAAQYFAKRLSDVAKEHEDSLKQLAQKESEEAWLEKKRQELMHRLQSEQGASGQIISKWTTSDKSAGIPDFTTSSGMPGYLAGGTFAVHKNPDGSETRTPYNEYLANQSAARPDQVSPLPHPPEFAAAIQAREMERLLAQGKAPAPPCDLGF